MIAGSLLGAVRHNGFIPWDDDLDIAMPRKDYEIFLNLAGTRLEAPLFLQTAWSDPGYYYGHAKVRNSMTTGIRKAEWRAGLKFNQGIFVDVFPIDNIPNSPLIRRNDYAKEIIVKHILRTSEYHDVFESHSLKGELFYQISKAWVKMRSPIKLYDHLEFLYRRHELEDTGFVGLISEFVESDRFKWPANYFDEYIEIPFYSSSAYIPKQYEKILDITYGDWRIPKNTGGEHGQMFFDTEQPYTEYLEPILKLTFKRRRCYNKS